mmetsp:Transcript_108/g.169  ORF Transcript_108/g.169 Transcript_108/m.169 type:complete len:137 (+) Transcript_108:90-500(+)
MERILCLNAFKLHHIALRSYLPFCLCMTNRKNKIIVNYFKYNGIQIYLPVSRIIVESSLPALVPIVLAQRQQQQKAFGKNLRFPVAVLIVFDYKSLVLVGKPLSACHSDKEARLLDRGGSGNFHQNHLLRHPNHLP